MDTRVTDGKRSLSGSLGVGSIVFMVVAAAAPLTVIAGAVPVGIALGDGAGFPATFVICCAVLLLFAVGFCAMSRHVPDAGAFYTYVQQGLGRVTGLGSAFLALATYTAVQLAVYGYFGAAVQALIVHYGGPELPWPAYSFAALALVGVLGYRHIELSSRLLGVLLVCEVAIVLVFDLVVTARGGHSGLSTAFLEPSEIASGSPGIGIMFAIASFLGFEATAVFRDEARDPERTVPRATYLALLLIGGFYTLSSWALVSAWGDDEVVKQAGADPGGILITSMTHRLGSVGGDVAQVLLVTSLFAALLSFHNVVARYAFSLGNSSALPASWGRAHTRHGSPHLASLAQSASALVLLGVFVAAGLDPVTQVFAWMAGTATLGVLVLMALTCLAVVVFFRRTKADTRPWHTLVAPVLGLAGLCACLALTVTNFPLLIGGSHGLALAIGAVLAAFFATGVVLALARPDAARALSRQPHPTQSHMEEPV
ncbi:APC family permease [Streptomyces sp. NPDC088350]|uniref:APC family permease n=1 Tax=Streptomyces sp. NPDC088350 TaxID=3365854 RepID=UPI00382813D0